MATAEDKVEKSPSPPPTPTPTLGRLKDAKTIKATDISKKISDSYSDFFFDILKLLKVI